jgi:hypothetical protein
MLDFSASDANGKTTIQRLPDIVPVNEAQVVHAFLLENGLTPSPQLATRTVREVVTLLTRKFLCVNMWELCGDGQLGLHGTKVEALASAATGTGSGESYMFEQCTSHVAKATQATLARRPDAAEGSTAISHEAPTAIPEGLPPNAVAATSSASEWNESQLVGWLRGEMGLDAVADAVAAEDGIDGAMALEMDKDCWKELGASNLKAAKIISSLKKLA